MHTTVIGSIDEQGFLPGWTEEKVLAIIGSVKIDLTQRPPGPGAHLSATAILGSIAITASPGTRIALDGISVLGSRRQRVSAGDGPELRVTANTVIGSVEVREATSP